jgi:hypothetical protein
MPDGHAGQHRQELPHVLQNLLFPCKCRHRVVFEDAPQIKLMEALRAGENLKKGLAPLSTEEAIGVVLWGGAGLPRRRDRSCADSPGPAGSRPVRQHLGHRLK